MMKAWSWFSSKKRCGRAARNSFPSSRLPSSFAYFRRSGVRTPIMASGDSDGRILTCISRYFVSCRACSHPYMSSSIMGSSVYRFHRKATSKRSPCQETGSDAPACVQGQCVHKEVLSLMRYLPSATSSGVKNSSCLGCRVSRDWTVGCHATELSGITRLDCRVSHDWTVGYHTTELSWV